MQGKTLKNIVGAGLAAVALAVTVAVALPSVSQAQTTTPAPSTVSPSSVAPGLQERRGGPGDFGGKMGLRGDNAQYLADALGITTEQLATAQQNARTAAIDEALSKGLITQAQADALKNGTGVGRGRGLGGFLFDESQIDMEALLAKALNISVEQLRTAQNKAFDAQLAAAVTAGNLTQEQADLMKAHRALGNYVQTNNVYEQIVKQAVQAGSLTQAQADAILAAQGARGGMRGFGGFGLEGFGGGRGGHRGGGF